MPKIMNFLTKFSDQRERADTSRAEARSGGRPCRPVFRSINPESE